VISTFTRALSQVPTCGELFLTGAVPAAVASPGISLARPLQTGTSRPIRVSATATWNRRHGFHASKFTSLLALIALAATSVLAQAPAPTETPAASASAAKHRSHRKATAKEAATPAAATGSTSAATTETPTATPPAAIGRERPPATPKPSGRDGFSQFIPPPAGGGAVMASTPAPAPSNAPARPRSQKLILMSSSAFPTNAA
jgi:hypothetical protein